MAADNIPIFSPEEQKENIANELELTKLICSGNVVLFVGAGCSAFSKYPPWPRLLVELKNLAQKVADDYGETFVIDERLADDDPLDYVQRIKEFIRGKGQLERYEHLVSQLYNSSGKQLHEIHRKIISFRNRGIITTNYDMLLEQALAEVEHDSDNCLDVQTEGRDRTSEFISSLNVDGCSKRVAHIHGIFRVPHNIILAKEDYAKAYVNIPEQIRSDLRDRLLSNGLPEEKAEEVIASLEAANPYFSINRKFLWTIFSTQHVVFIGFSLNDPFINVMLDLVCRDLWRWGGNNHYAVFGISPDKSEYLKQRAIDFKDRFGICSIFYENQNGDHQNLITLINKIYEECSSARAATPRAEAVEEAAPVIVAEPTAKSETSWMGSITGASKRRVRPDED